MKKFKQYESKRVRTALRAALRKGELDGVDYQPRKTIPKKPKYATIGG